jgi:hypothetical protein
MFSQKVEWSENERKLKEKDLGDLNTKKKKRQKNRHEKEYLIDIKYFSFSMVSVFPVMSISASQRLFHN